MNVDELVVEIEHAFDGVPRSHISLRQFQLTDRFGMSREISDKEWAQAGKARADSRWQDIPDSEMEDCGSQFGHMQAEEFQYYLPAYMRYSLLHLEQPLRKSGILGSVLFNLHPNTRDNAAYAYQVSQLSLLDDRQKRAIVHYLKFVATHADYLHAPDAENALEQYWSRIVST